MKLHTTLLSLVLLTTTGAAMAANYKANPNGEGLPQWDAYTPENGKTMIFDNQPEVKAHHDEKLQRLLARNLNF